MAFPTQSAHFVSSSSQAFSSTYNPTGSAFTVEAWIKPSSVSTFGTIAGSLDGSGVQGFGFFVDDGTAGELFFQSSGGEVHSTGASLTAGAWQHVAVTIDGSNARFYVNGSLVGSPVAFTGTVTSSTQATWIGAYALSGSGSGFFNGNIGMVRVWTTTVSAANISANKCTELGATTNLGAEWTLDNTLSDNSGNSHTLTNHNTATFQADVTSSCSVVATPHLSMLLGVGN